MSNDFYNKISEELTKLENISRLRKLETWTESEYNTITFDNKKYVNLSSNDYLSIASDKKYMKEFIRLINENDNFSSSSSRLLTGNSIYYRNIEDLLSELYNSSILIFNSGYHLNTGIIPVIAGKHDIILSDKLNHASIIDGAKLSGAELFRYKHLDYNELESLLKSKRENYKNCIIISESVFSMDGDTADIKKLAELKNKYNCLLYIDEAHSFGLYSKYGCGVVHMNGHQNDTDIITATFGKAGGSYGAFAVVKPVMKNYLINKARSFIFSTALSPIQLKWTEFALKKIIELDNERNELKNKSLYFRKKLKKKGHLTNSDSHIIPVITGNDNEAVKLSEKLKDRGYYVLPVRPPAVPAGTSRLRISLNPFIKYEQLDEIIELIS